MTTRVYTSTSIDTTLATSIGAGDTTATVATGTGAALLGGITLVPGDIFTVALDPDTVNEEIVYVTARAGDTLTIDRAEAGTDAVTHAAGATIRHVLSSDDLNWFNNMIQSDDIVTATPKIYGGSASALNKKIMNRADTAANWTSNNPTLNAGEIGFESDTGKFKIGNGSSVWTGLDYAVTPLPSQTGHSGEFLTTNGTTASWGAISTPALAINAQTDNYTLVASDVNKLVTIDSTDPKTVVIPAGVFTTGQEVNLQRLGTGNVTIDSDGTTTYTGTGTTLRAQYSAATLICTGTNTFTLVGDLA